MPMPSNPIQRLRDTAYLRYFGQRQRSSLTQVGQHDNNGLFAPACLDHGSDFNLNNSKITIDGVALRDAMLDWLRTNGSAGAAANVHMEKCAEKGLGIPCSVPSGACRKLPFLAESHELVE